MRNLERRVGGRPGAKPPALARTGFIMEETMDGIIQEGKTVEEAKRRGLAALGMPEEDVHVIVLDEGPKGIFKIFGGRNARVKVVPAVSEEERVHRIVERLLSAMGFGAQVDVSARDRRISVLIETAGMDGLLIGRHGQTLDALQHLIERIVNRGRGERRRVTVDVGGYRKRRQDPARSRSGSRDKTSAALRARNRAEARGDAVVAGSRKREGGWDNRSR